jgi:alkylhydroperoxidase family enzyme
MTTAPTVTTRIAPAQPPYAPTVDEDLARLMPPGVPPLSLFRTLAHNPRVLRRVRRGGLLDPGALSLRERELVILRTTARCGSEYEWGVHVAFFGAAAGFDAAALAATVHGAADDPAWSARERLLVALCDALHDRGDVDDALFTALRANFDEAQLLEATVLVGQYHMISFVTRVAGVACEPAAPRFPRRPAPPPEDPRRQNRV